MPRIPPVQPTLYSSPIEPFKPQESKEKIPISPTGTSHSQKELGFKAEVIPTKTSSDIVKECGKLHGASLDLAKDVAHVESIIAQMDVIQKGEAAIGSIALLPIAHVDFTQENLLDPLTILDESGISIGTGLEEVNQSLLNVELVLRTMQGLGEGVVLILRQQHLSEAKRFLEMLRLKSLQLPPAKNKTIQFNEYLEELDKKIRQEEIALGLSAEEYGISNAGYLPTAASHVWGLCEHASSVASTALGWVGGIASSGICYYEKHKAKESKKLHTKFVDEITRLSEKHASAISPETDDATLEKRKELKDRLKALTLNRHENIDTFLEFNSIKKDAKFYAVSFLTIAYLALQTAALFVAVSAFVMFPQFALLGAVVALMAVGIFYWATNRPNLFKELLLTCMKSLYYSIGSAIDSWKLQSKKVKLLEHSARHIDLLAQGIRSGKPDTGLVEAFVKEHNNLKKSVETLEGDVKYWTAKKEEIHERLVDAELADMNRVLKQKSLSVKSLVDHIKGVYKNLTDDDKTELKEVVGLNLERMGTDPPAAQIQERLLTSYLGTEEDQLIKSLKLNHEFQERHPLG